MSECVNECKSVSRKKAGRGTLHAKAIARVKAAAKVLPSTWTARERAEEDCDPFAASGHTVPPFGRVEVGINT